MVRGSALACGSAEESGHPPNRNSSAGFDVAVFNAAVVETTFLAHKPLQKFARGSGVKGFARFPPAFASILAATGKSAGAAVSSRVSAVLNATNGVKNAIEIPMLPIGLISRHLHRSRSHRAAPGRKGKAA